MNLHKRPEVHTPELTHREILAVLGGLMTALFLAALDQTIVATALPAIVADIGAPTSLSWVVTAYLLAATVSVPLYGKLSDLHGRKRLFQLAIVIFVCGSATSGLAQTMGQLVASRAVQGIGAGGLLALSQALIGDMVPPRQRGRYMGYVGAVFAVASVMGPVLGGFLVDHLSWRWTFYINVPLGAAAIAITERKMHLVFPRRPHRIDYVGAALLATSVSALLLVTTWGGQTYRWGSPLIVALSVVAVATAAAFLFVERQAAEPIVPLHLFADRVFAVSNMLGLVIGVAMFPVITYLPLFLQVATRASPTSSGFVLLPLVVSLLVGTITSGRLLTRWGRYKVFPVAGTALLTVGLSLLATMGVATSRPQASLYMAVVGLGIGLVIQVVVLAAQNSVPVGNLGVATSAAQFFRSIGGAFGVALFGALLNARLDPDVVGSLAGGTAAARGGDLLVGPSAATQLPPALGEAVRVAVADSITSVFLLVVPVAVVAFGLACALQDLPLRSASNPPVSPTKGA